MKRFHVMVTVLALVGMSTTAVAQQQRGRLFARLSGIPLDLLEMQAVQDELNLTEEQKQKLEALQVDRDSFQNLSLEERIKERAKKANETIKNVLDERQQKRLDELRIQREGVMSLFRNEFADRFGLEQVQVADKLGLEQAQKDKIKEIQKQYTLADDATFAKLRNATQEERRKVFEEDIERDKKTNAELLAVLTPAQKEAFEKLQGEKFDFPRRDPAQNQ